MSSTYLTNDEMKFIINACRVKDGFMDYENTSDEEFEKLYGYSKEESEKIEKSLWKKIKHKIKS